MKKYASQTKSTNENFFHVYIYLLNLKVSSISFFLLCKA
jgi:hypothetical protein